MKEEIKQGIPAMQFLKMQIEQQEQELQNKLKEDNLPSDLKFGEFNFEYKDGSYQINQFFHIDDEFNNKDEMLALSQLLNKFYEDRK